MRITRTARFKRAWERLTEPEKEVARKALKNLENDISYPSLRVKKMKGTEQVWEARANLSLRITFEIENGVIVLRNIGQHDEALDNP